MVVSNKTSGNVPQNYFPFPCYYCYDYSFPRQNDNNDSSVSAENYGWSEWTIVENWVLQY